MVRTAGGISEASPWALWVAMRHNVLPGEYYAYALWQPNRRKNIDNYLYSHEAARLFKLLNRPLRPDPIGDKLAFFEMCKAHALPTPAVLAAFAPNGKLLEFDFDLPPQHDLFVKAPRRHCRLWCRAFSLAGNHLPEQPWPAHKT